MAYAVEDLQASMEHWIKTVGGGPFFITEHFELLDAKYCGKPAPLDIDLDVGYSGGLCIEFIKQNDSAPSVYNETGGLCSGVHHVGVMVEDFDAEVARHLAAGYEIATSFQRLRSVLSDTNPSVGAVLHKCLDQPLAILLSNKATQALSEQPVYLPPPSFHDLESHDAQSHDGPRRVIEAHDERMREHVIAQLPANLFSRLIAQLHRPIERQIV